MLTPQDIKIIQSIVQASEERLTNRISTVSEQILEYTNSVRDSHEEWLKNHEKRISKLENIDVYRS